jgi:hypothetical protein
MPQANSDWGFVGESYTAPDPYQDRQETINWYPEVSSNKMKTSKVVVALLGCPGLIQVATVQGL